MSRHQPHFHRNPPYSPRHLFDRPVVLEATLVLALALAALAAFDGGRILLTVDEPIMRWVVDVRNDGWDDFFTWASRLGDNRTVFPIGLLLAALCWHRCRVLAIALIVAAAARPGFEFVLKDLVDRVRPDIDPVSEFAGPSHPSGHPMAAVSVWGLLPPVVALFGASRRLWWTVTTAVSVIVVLVAVSRVYRGAHWPTDVFASIVWGTMFLLAVEMMYDHLHDRREQRDDVLSDSTA